MKQRKMLYSVAIAAILAGNMSYACDRNNVGSDCAATINTTSVNNTTNSTTNNVTTTFSQQSADAAMRLKNVYQTVANVGQINSGDIYAQGAQDNIVTKGQGDVTIGVTAIGNNASANLVGLQNVNLSIAQKNSGEITVYNSVTNPNVGGNLAINTTAVGNSATVGWDLTTDKNPSNDAFAVKKDGPTLSFSNVGSYVGSVEQCNTGAVTAMLDYNQDPASNIQINTSAIGNNLSFGVQTR